MRNINEEIEKSLRLAGVQINEALGDVSIASRIKGLFDRNTRIKNQATRSEPIQLGAQLVYHLLNTTPGYAQKMEGLRKILMNFGEDRTSSHFINAMIEANKLEAGIIDMTKRPSFWGGISDKDKDLAALLGDVQLSGRSPWELVGMFEKSRKKAVEIEKNEIAQEFGTLMKNYK